MSTNTHYKAILEAALLSAGRPLTVDHLELLFTDEMQPPTRREIRQLLAELRQDCEARGVELNEVASGFRFQVKGHLHPWLKHLVSRRTPRYSRALLETLALVAYRQPITRAEIEKIRGVSVSTQIMRNLQDYQWIRVIGHRETPGRPALYGTTKAFLDHFNLKHLSDLPTLAELRDLELQPDLPEDEEDEGDDDSLEFPALPHRTDDGLTLAITESDDDEAMALPVETAMADTSVVEHSSALATPEADSFVEEVAATEFSPVETTADTSEMAHSEALATSETDSTSDAADVVASAEETAETTELESQIDSAAPDTIEPVETGDEVEANKAEPSNDENDSTDSLETEPVLPDDDVNVSEETQTTEDLPPDVAIEDTEDDAEHKPRLESD